MYNDNLKPILLRVQYMTCYTFVLLCVTSVHGLIRDEKIQTKGKDLQLHNE